MATPVSYGDISPRVAAHSVARMLTRGLPYLILEKFGQVYQMPTKSSKVAIWRRYNALALATTPLVEGVTPAGQKPTVTDVQATLQQYGDYIPYTDVIEDTHEDPVLQQFSDLLGEQQAQTIETLRYNVIKAGTNKYLANGSLRSDVNTAISTSLQRKATRALKRQNASHITQPVSSSVKFNTENIEAAFIAVCHTDVENDVREMDGFTNTKNYGTVTPWMSEIGAVEDVRYLRSTLFVPFTDAGGAAGAMISTTGTYADVYPVIIIAKDSYGIVSLKGKNNSTVMVVNPKPAAGDPLAQRGTMGWKAWHAAVILNDAWLIRLEVAATA